MKKVERDIKKYYKKALKHSTSLEQIKKESCFFDTKKRMNLKPFAFVCSLSFVAIFSITMIGIANNNKQNKIAISQKLQNAIVEIDASSKIVLTLNKEGKVSSFKSLDEDGALVIFEEKILNKSFSDALTTITQRQIEMGYLVSNESKWNQFSMNVYTCSQINLDSLKEEMTEYFNKKNVVFDSNLQIEYGEDVSKLGYNSFSEAYKYFNGFNVMNYTPSLNVLDDLNYLLQNYSNLLAECKTLYDVSHDESINTYYNELKMCGNNLIDGYYNMFIKEDCSYQAGVNKLLNEKKELLKGKKDNNFDYEKKLEKINSSISSLNTWKEWIYSALNSRFSSYSEKVETISKYLDENEKNYDIEIYENNYIDTLNEYQKKYKNGTDKIYSTLRNVKNDLISFFK